jgi:hypothetical protein
MNKIIILFIILLSNCELSSSFNIRNYINDLDRAVSKACNRKALTITNNSNMYNCLLVNKTSNCSYIENYENYITLKKMCIDKHNTEISLGIYISIISWIIIGLLFHK